MARTYIKLFFDCLEGIEALDDAERGRLFTALLVYGKTGETIALEGNERFVFPMLRAQLARDTASYEGLCETNRRNGARGGRPPKKTSGIPETEKTQDKEKEKDEDKDKDEEKEKDKDSSSGASRPRQAPGLRDRAPGQRPAGRSQTERKYISRKDPGRDSPQTNHRLLEEMLRYRDQLCQEKETLAQSP